MARRPSSAASAIRAERAKGHARQVVGLEIAWTDVETLYTQGGADAAGAHRRLTRRRARLQGWPPGGQGDVDDVVARAEKLIALATIDRPHFATGTTLEVEIRSKPCAIARGRPWCRRRFTTLRRRRPRRPSKPGPHLGCHVAQAFRPAPRPVSRAEALRYMWRRIVNRVGWICVLGQLHGLPAVARLLRRPPRGLAHAPGLGARAGPQRLEAGTLSLGEAFAFMSGLYFRGKIAYATAFGRRADGGVPATYVITPTRGLQSPDLPITGRSSRSSPRSMWPPTSLATSSRWWPMRGRWPTRCRPTRASCCSAASRPPSTWKCSATRSARGSTFRQTSSGAAT